MKPPRIEWNYKHMPSNRDEMQPLGAYEVDGSTMMIAINLTKNELFFVWDDHYGKLISGGSE